VFGKLYHTVAVVSIAITLAGGALIGLLYGTGKLTPDRVDSIAEILRGESEEAGQAEEDTTASEQTASDEEDKARSEEEIRQQQRESQLHRALIERARQDVIAQRELLDRSLQHLITEQESFEDQQAAAKAALERRKGEVADEGFQKELRIVSKLSPKLAKEHLVRKWKESPADAVRLLSAMSESTSKRILGQMKTPEELQIMHELLERLSEDKVVSVKRTSGRTAGD
jgi:hypothetical protein